MATHSVLATVWQVAMHPSPAPCTCLARACLQELLRQLDNLWSDVHTIDHQVDDPNAKARLAAHSAPAPSPAQRPAQVSMPNFGSNIFVGACCLPCTCSLPALHLLAACPALARCLPCTCSLPALHLLAARNPNPLHTHLSSSQPTGVVNQGPAPNPSFRHASTTWTDKGTCQIINRLVIVRRFSGPIAYFHSAGRVGIARCLLLVISSRSYACVATLPTGTASGHRSMHGRQLRCVWARCLV
jgi:hypothetical protein